MFKTADTKTTYVRMPIINYVRACPLPAAKQALEEFKKIDPGAVKRSMTFFPTIPKDSQITPPLRVSAVSITTAGQRDVRRTARGLGRSVWA